MKRTTLLSLIILVILAVITYFVLQQPGEHSRIGAGEDVLITYDSAAVTRIEIDGSKGHVVLEKEAGTWMITDPLQYPAEQFMAVRAVGTGRSIRLKGTPVSSNPSKRGLFQVDSTGTLVRVFTGDTEAASFRIGKTTTSFSETYVRAEGSDDVYITEGLLNSSYDKEASGWRDKTIFRASREDIKEIRFAYGDTVFTVARVDSGWAVDGSPIGEPTSFLASLSQFNTQDFVDSTITEPPPLTATLTVNDVPVRFHALASGTDYFVQTSRSPQWFRIQQWKAKQLLLRERTFDTMKR